MVSSVVLMPRFIVGFCYGCLSLLLVSVMVASVVLMLRLVVCLSLLLISVMVDWLY